jgi:hypothetical protein
LAIVITSSTIIIIYGNHAYVLARFVFVEEEKVSEIFTLNQQQNFLNITSLISYNVLFTSKGQIYLDTVDAKLSFQNLKLFSTSRKVDKYIQRTITGYDGFTIQGNVGNIPVDVNVLNEMKKQMLQKGTISVVLTGNVFVQYGVVLGSFPKYFETHKEVFLNFTK